MIGILGSEKSPKEWNTLFYKLIYREKKPSYVGVDNSGYISHTYIGDYPVGRVLSEDGFSLSINNLKMTPPSNREKI